MPMQAQALVGCLTCPTGMVVCLTCPTGMVVWLTWPTCMVVWFTCPTGMVVWLTCPTGMVVCLTCPTGMVVWLTCPTGMVLWLTWPTCMVVRFTCPTGMVAWLTCPTGMVVWLTCSTGMVDRLTSQLCYACHSLWLSNDMRRAWWKGPITPLKKRNNVPNQGCYPGSKLALALHKAYHLAAFVLISLFVRGHARSISGRHRGRRTPGGAKHNGKHLVFC